MFLLLEKRFKTWQCAYIYITVYKYRKEEHRNKSLFYTYEILLLYYGVFSAVGNCHQQHRHIKEWYFISAMLFECTLEENKSVDSIFFYHIFQLVSLCNNINFSWMHFWVHCYVIQNLGRKLQCGVTKWRSFIPHDTHQATW